MEIQIRNIERLRYFLSAVLLMVAVSLFAQSNGDKLFMEGQALQQKQTIASQRQAVKKFEAAKVVYATAGKKKMCDNQIAICYNNINALRRASSKGIKEKKTEPQNQEEMLSLSQHAVAFEGDKKGKSMVAVTAPRAEWKFSLSEGIDGEDNFAKVSKSLDAKSLNIEVDINPLTTERHQNIVVSLDGQNDTLHVTQKGKEVLLSTSTNLVEFKLKGGNKSIELYTNSDSIINSNNGLTWYVKSKPEWIETAVDVNRKKSCRRVLLR